MWKILFAGCGGVDAGFLILFCFFFLFFCFVLVVCFLYDFDIMFPFLPQSLRGGLGLDPTAFARRSRHNRIQTALSTTSPQFGDLQLRWSYVLSTGRPAQVKPDLLQFMSSCLYELPSNASCIVHPLLGGNASWRNWFDVAPTLMLWKLEVDVRRFTSPWRDTIWKLSNICYR